MTRATIPNCPQPETPLRERAWTDEQRLARLRELAGAEKLLAILDADGGGPNDMVGGGTPSA